MNHSPLTTHHSPSAPSAALPRFEFHISRKARVRYQFDQSLYSLTGNVILADYRAVRALADKMNAVRDAKQNPDQAVRAGQLNAMGLIDEILHFVAARYRAERNPNAMAKALNWLGERMGQDALDRTLLEFVTLFPPLAVHQSQQTPSQYLAGETGGYPHRCIVLEEVMLLSLTNENPAFAPFIELFDDADLRQQPGYVRIKSLLDDFFRTQPTYGPYGQMLTDLLRAPVKASPYSLTGQLLYIKEHWRFFIPGEMLDRLVHRLLVALDYIQEEERPRGLGPGPAVVPTFREGALATDLEWEQYSSDLDWMPKAVLMVKHTYVWLHQLSVKYGRGITRLDQVPDEELDMLGQWGFTGLWLIGLWQRSPASAKIKQRCGNPEAISSAYSLYAYEIADELGGYAAFDSLRARAWQRGIRMAVDMVPNHVGLYSRWTVEHPDWFIQLDHPPFPSYGFSGHDLSDDDRIGLQIEDGYWSRSDAAVVFKWWNKRTGETRYIYHGNDGTCMPWNDTAQLNFLIPAVREAVIQEILKVARHAPIIRFDAAMTLTKRHYHRLWYPEPGSGGDIPSRAGRGMSRPDFDHVFPQEFWREVVDRVAKEAPDTLLLAEAFWLMEGYFVRTLGMHRVYNSAFMNMLKAEENANYRSVIKNILEFDPEILRRLVNFMNNPDEQTAVAQFGKGDKYLGVCLMMATMPGLPMFGHGQLEGFTEKYGMEYRRAYWDEPTDWDLLERHKREVFPLLRKRYLFSGTENFFLYDLYDRHGKVNEDVFAYSNRCGHERALVLYNNRYAHAAGWVRMSVGYVQKREHRLVQKNLAEGLGLSAEPGVFYAFREFQSGLEFLRSGRELAEKGLYVELGAYKCRLYWEFREVRDESGDWGRLCGWLQGRGVPSLDEAMQQMRLEPVLAPLREWFHPEPLREMLTLYQQKLDLTPAWQKLDPRLTPLSRAIERHLGTPTAPVNLTALLQALSSIENAARKPSPSAVAKPPVAPQTTSATTDSAKASLEPLPSLIPTEQGPRWPFGRVLFTWLLLKPLFDGRDAPTRVCLIPEWAAKKVVQRTLMELGADPVTAEREYILADTLAKDAPWFTCREALTELLQSEPIKRYLGCNWYEGVLWFNKESFESLLNWLFTATALQTLTATPDRAAAIPKLTEAHTAVTHLLAQSAKSGHRFHDFLDLLCEEPPTPTGRAEQ